MTCPHPEKMRHVSCAAALVHLELLDRKGKADLNVRPYRCGDHWHIGHRRPSLKRQLQQAIGDGRKKSRRRKARR